MPILKFYKYLLYFVLIITVIGTIFLFNQQHKPTTHNTQQEASRLKYLKYHLQIKGFNFNSFDDGKNVLSIKADKVTVENKKLGFFRLGLINVAIFKNAIIDLYLSGGLETMRDVFQAFGMIRNSNDFLDVGPPYDTPAELPEDSPNGEAVRQFLAGPYITLLNEALTNLTKIGSSFDTTLTADETGSQPVEIDYGDVLMFKTI